MKQARRETWWSAVTIATAIAAAGCSSSNTTGGSSGTDGGTEHEPDASTPQDSGAGMPDAGAPVDASSTPDAATGSTLAIKVPSTFTGTTRQLVVVTETSLPPMGPPSGILYQANAPAVTAGDTLHLTVDTSGASGDDYLLVVLYMQGGGMYSPKAGVDYEAATMAKVHFDGKPHDLGELDLVLAQ